MATDVQADVAIVLDDLKFESVPGGMPGSPARIRVVEETVTYLQSLLDEGKMISVGSDGAIMIQ